MAALLGGTGFLVLPLCVDADGIARGRPFFDDIGIRNRSLYWAEPLRVQLAFGFVGLATTLLIDRSSREIGRLQEPLDWNSADTKAQFGQVLRQQRSVSERSLHPDRIGTV